MADNISGLFEIHITVHPNQGFYKLWAYVNANKNMKLILAVSDTGEFKEQYMISKWKNGKYRDVVARADEIANEMRSQGINVVRVKVESMAHNDGVPIEEDEFTTFMENSKDLIGKPYFEFHAKVDLRSMDLEDFENWIAKVKNNFGSDTYIATSTNICGSKLPLLTIRIYNHGRKYAIETKDNILESFKDAGFKILDSIQQEFSVYDTNDKVDDGWLY